MKEGKKDEKRRTKLRYRETAFRDTMDDIYFCLRRYLGMILPSYLST